MQNPLDTKQLKVIGRRLKKAREERGLSRAELGNKLDVTECMVGHIENGVRRLRPNKASALEDALGVSPAFVWPDVFQPVAA